MAERHIREDYVSCDWCKKELSGSRCTKGTDIERILLGNLSLGKKHEVKKTEENQVDILTYEYRWGPVSYFNGLEFDLCDDCQSKLIEHIKSFIFTRELIDAQLGGD